ncbi:helix-turn-helix domain-containing protein [Radiobacillus deserti]|uniref:MerR family transcriptional regulator n=1 Tax=Radiobacillus deserti TaxID=2594883 RepID=A0A516KKH2_9BACI|nr:MerR family transcriptional regulator [Radiobacillus deserti]QDP41887.1 MerR family transcriptional regulator [Radiobacillus deserti]
MSSIMSIQAFAKRTGISKTALRYYEQKNLLTPKRGKENLYRYYEEHQVKLAKWIASLRTANVPINEIQAYLTTNPKEQRDLIKKWERELLKKRKILDVGIKYLQSTKEEQEFYLAKIPAQTIIWFKEEAKIGRFKHAFKKRQKQLNIYGYEVDNAYLAYLSGEDIIQVKVGFTLRSSSLYHLPEDSFVEKKPAQHCVVHPFKKPIADIQEGYEEMMQYVLRNKWYPAGPIYEWYHGEGWTDLDIVMPVFEMKEEEEQNE